MSERTKIARKVARRVFLSYYSDALPTKTAFKASTPLHKMMGEVLSRSMGITDAPEKFFTDAEAYLEGVLDQEGLDMDLDDPEVYPHIRSAINEIAKKMDLI